MKRDIERPVYDYSAEVMQGVRHANPAQLITWLGGIGTLGEALYDQFAGDDADWRTFLALVMKAARNDADMMAWFESYAKAHDAREFKREGER